MVVVIIVAILAAIAMPLYTNTVEKEKGNICANNIRIVLQAWELYNLRNPSAPYNPASYEFLSTEAVNLKFGISINERNFGQQNTNTTGFWFYKFDPNETYPALYTCTYRISSGPYKNTKFLGSAYFYKKPMLAGFRWYWKDPPPSATAGCTRWNNHPNYWPWPPANE
jgi:Tfp pilus assembly protein PilE